MAGRIELLADKLDADLARRRREVSDLRLAAKGASGAKANALYRAGHVMAYATWEGFVKVGLCAYLKYICDIQKPLTTLKLGLRASMLASKLTSISGGDNSFLLATKALEVIENGKDEIFAISPEEMTRTGNLSSKKFRSLLSMCSLEYLDYYLTREPFIDEVLCGRRHRIAHGGMEPVSGPDLDMVAEGALSLCDRVNNQIVETLLEGAFVEDP